MSKGDLNILNIFIKNTSQLLNKDLDGAQLNLRKIGLTCLEKALNSVKPKTILKNSILIQDNRLIINNDSYSLNDYDKIFIIGGGKASAMMLIGLEKILLNFPNIEYKGFINIPDGLEVNKSEITGRIKLNYASHPIPSETGLYGVKKMMELIKSASKNDLIFCLISGGGSALLPLPKKDIKLKDLQKINSMLLASGASIHEINTVRKHLSDIKGGNLAKKIYHTSGATLITLIISDVVGDDLGSIASGPTIPDLTTFNEAVNILKKYNIYEKIPPSIKEILKKGLINEELENPKPNNICFDNVHNYLIGSVESAAKDLLLFLKEMTFDVKYFSNQIVGEAKEFGKMLYQIITQEIEENVKGEKKDKKALIGTGELTVTIQGEGIGGRNQEMLLSFLDFIKDKNFNFNFLIIAANLDGIEGNSKAMGALVDNYILTRMVETHINIQKFLDNNDSNSLFKILESEIITGPTGCNVNDLILILIKK